MNGIRRDLRTILRIQALRAFVYGFASVVLGTSLAASGFTDVQVGLVFSAMLGGAAITSIAVGLWGDRAGRRRLYAVLLAGMGVCGAVFALTGSLPILVAAALTGTLSTDPNESGPITSLEQAMIGQAPPMQRLRMFGHYNAIAYLAGAVGALVGGGPSALRGSFPSLPADQRWLLVFPAVALACLALVRNLSGATEPAADPGGGSGSPAPRPHTGPLGRSRRIVAGLASLFALDAFAGGFVVQTFLVFWLGRRFGAGPELLGLAFFLVGLLQATSSLVAARLGARFGLLHTMVFTHLPSNVLLMLVPLAPSLGTALGLLFARSALSQMDVPTRQAYVVGIVDPDERAAAAAFTNTARYVVRPVGPLVGGVLMQTATGAPFFAAGALKIVYDLLLWRAFGRTRVPDEDPTPRPSA